MKREYCIRGLQDSEVLFELRSRDPRDLIQVVFTRVPGICEFELLSEDIQGARRLVQDSIVLRRGPHLYDELEAVATRWQKSPRPRRRQANQDAERSARRISSPSHE